MWVAWLEICLGQEKESTPCQSCSDLQMGGEVPLVDFLHQLLYVPSSSSLFLNCCNLFAYMLCMHPFLCRVLVPLPSVTTCSHVFPAVPAFLHIKALPAQLSWFSPWAISVSPVKLQVCNQLFWIEPEQQSELSCAAIMLYPKEVFDAMTWSFQFFFFFPN